MSDSSAPGPRSGTDLALAGLAALVSGLGLLWLAGMLSAVLSGHQAPGADGIAGGVAGALNVLTDPGHPGWAWGGSVGPPVLYWGCVAVLAAVVAGLFFFLVRLLRTTFQTSTDPYAGPPPTWPGLATRRQVEQAAGTSVLQRRGATLRPSLEDPSPAEIGFRLGASRGRDCWASVEDSVVVVGPPRSGKGLHLVIDAILDAPGAVVTTSTRPDNIAATIEARSTGGHPVMVFDPQGLAEGVPAALRWSLVRGCEDTRIAMARAKALVGDPASGVESGSFWSQQCESAVRCLLHAAALAELEALDLYEWSLSVTRAQKAVEILRDDSRAAPGWARALSAILDSDPRQRDSVWAMVSNTFAALSNSHVLNAVSPTRAETFDPAAFIQAGGTAYLLGTASGASATSRLVATFVEDIIEAARRIAARSSGFRLDPPMALILDEAANYPLPSLPSLMSEGGGSGISTWVFLQSRAQARSRWGDDDADTIWDAAIVKIILGGGGHADDLGDLSALLGVRKVRKSSVSYGSGSRSWSEHSEEHPILEAAQIRRIPMGYGLLVLRTAAPIMLQLDRWTQRRDAGELTAARDRVEASIRTGPVMDVADAVVDADATQPIATQGSDR